MDKYAQSRAVVSILAKVAIASTLIAAKYSDPALARLGYNSSTGFDKAYRFMAKEATVRARIDSGLKAEVEDLFEALGLSTTEAITLFYHQVRLRKGLPFEVAIPNSVTRKVFEETDRGENLVKFENTDAIVN